MTPVIEVTGLTKRYGGRRGQAVVDGISLHVDQGEIFGILGPNGAGKTTAVECVEGLRRRDGGQVRILGLDPCTDGYRVHQRTGVQLQETQLQEMLKVREALELYASFYPHPADWRFPSPWPRQVDSTSRPRGCWPSARSELDILGLIARGYSNREAAAGLFISEARSRPACCTSTRSSASTTAPPPWRPGSSVACCPAPWNKHRESGERPTWA